MNAAEENQSRSYEKRRLMKQEFEDVVGDIFFFFFFFFRCDIYLEFFYFYLNSYI